MMKHTVVSGDREEKTTGFPLCTLSSGGPGMVLYLCSASSIEKYQKKSQNTHILIPNVQCYNELKKDDFRDVFTLLVLHGLNLDWC